MSQTLDPISLPLWGSRLIEASAGTGKTWTIAALYLRLVLGHGGDDHAYSRPLDPPEILVMTFTRAATRELSDRIRSRLLEAARCFRGEAEPAAGDALLAGLLAAYPTGAARTGAAWRLSLAAESMDDAAVHTIDAWCQRMLREHAFDSGCLFDEELEPNERAVQARAAQDYWRQQVYPLSPEALDVVLAVWPDVDALTLDARQLLDQPLPAGAAQGSLSEAIERCTAARGAALAALKTGWAQRAGEMRAWLDAQMAMSSATCPFNKHKLGAHLYTDWLSRLAAWAADSTAERPDLSKPAAARLIPAGMRDAFKPGAAIQLPPHFAAFEQLLQALDALRPLASGLRLHAAARVAERLAQLKAESGAFGFADMLTRLDDALNPELNPANAQRLRPRIVTQYPVALVDEFQDTSPVQSRIFDRLYDIAANDRGSALLLIGDPKQSIYGFRGADIYSYLTARRATAGRHYVLGTNHRSTADLVAAVNHLFFQAEARDGEAAFMFGAGAGAATVAAVARVIDGDDHEIDSNPLPFVAVAPKGRPESFVTSGGAVPPMNLNLDAHLLDAASYRRQFAARCAERIVMLLNDAGAGFHAPGLGLVRLRPADIAVLVRTGKEAAAVRRELRRRNVASVYLSDQDSVFASGEARDLLHWLRAVAAPLDVRLARAAFATRTAGLTLDELTRLATDDAAFDLRSEQLRQLHGVWQGQGVLTMLRQSLHGLDLPSRWLGTVAVQAKAENAKQDQRADEPGTGSATDHDGERRLTNFLHLAELLQAASVQQPGEQGLIRWLAEQIDAGASGADEQIVRLESDADLVKVVTVYKSKGLEYPLVFLPFASSFRGVVSTRNGFVNEPDHGDEGVRTLHLAPTPAQLAAADKERHREDLRLLYVALTRARHTVWVGLAALKAGQSNRCIAHRSAIGYLLHGAEPVHQDALTGQIEALIAPCSHIVLSPVEASALTRRTRLLPRGAPAALRELPPYSASFERRWTVGSFSGLVRASAAPGPGPATPSESTPTAAAARDDEVLESTDDPALAAREAALPVEPSPADAATSADRPWHTFARGALTGNFLHDQLEWLAGQGFDLEGSDDLQQQLLRRCERQGFGARGPEVSRWLAQVVKMPLPPVGAALDAIAAPLPEMEFWFPSAGLAAGRIDRLCRSHLLAGRDRPALPERELRGMLMGFADLVFEHGGVYWVLDYKSNHLGPHDADYALHRLEAAMAAHRYDVQAALYLLALHRLLQARLGAGYEPARQLGGAIYFFLRGIRGPAKGCYLVAPSLRLLTALDALLRSPQELPL